VYNRFVPNAKSPDDLSVEELRQLLVEKRRKTRLEHLERFRKTGRVIALTSDRENTTQDHLHSDTQAEPGPETDHSLLKSPTKHKLDRLLLTIEVLAVIGLVFVVYNGFKILRDLNTQFAKALTPSTLTPTPLIAPVILPSGHTPPNSPGGSQPNEAEIPAHLRPLFSSMADIPIPTAGPEQATQIQIAAINVDAPIVQGDSWEQLKKGVGQYIGSADPGQPGNMVLSAHNDVYGEIFRHLDKLQPGDQIIIYTSQYSFTYTVSETQIVKPTDVEVMASTSDPTLTLISCYPYMVDNKRIIVRASLEGSEK
jgi:sortase A